MKLMDKAGREGKPWISGLYEYRVTPQSGSITSPFWVQHRQNATREPATVLNQCALNSYWIMQENGTEQPKVYRCTRTMLKIRSTPTEAEQTGYMNNQSTVSKKGESYIPTIPNMVRDCVKENSLENETVHDRFCHIYCLRRIVDFYSTSCLLPGLGRWVRIFIRRCF